MTNSERQTVLTAHREARQAERAIGSLQEALRRCKRGSATYASYLRRIEAFERKSAEATDALDAVLILALVR